MSVAQNTPLVRSQLLEIFGKAPQIPATVLDTFGPTSSASSDAASADLALQPSSATKPSPIPNETTSRQPQVLYFVYDHYFDPARFVRNFPGSVWVGVAFITNFTWHLTMDCVANIRQAFKSGNRAEDYTSYVYGYVFAIDGSVDEVIRHRMRYTHARLNVDAQLIRVSTNTTGIKALTTSDAMRSGLVSVVTYADVRNTRNCTQAALAAKPINLAAWARGLKCLHLAGASRKFLVDVRKCLFAKKEMDEGTPGSVVQQLEFPDEKQS